MCLLRVPLRAFSARDCVRVRAMGVPLGGFPLLPDGSSANSFMFGIKGCEGE